MLKESDLGMGSYQVFNPLGSRNFNERVERKRTYCQQALELQGKPLHNYSLDSLVDAFIQLAEMMIFLSSRMIIGY